MTIILRLQGLDVKAGTEDIRTFFGCLHIPEGGVYIVGGSLREAFIAFTSEKDAQSAMRLTGNLLKGSQVRLYISSMEELEHKLKSMLKRKKPSPARPTAKRPKKSPDCSSVLPSNTRPDNHLTVNQETANPPPTALDHNTSNLLQVSNADKLDSNTAFLLGICTVLQGLQSSNQIHNNEALPRVDFPKAGNAVTFVSKSRAPEQAVNSQPGYVRLFGLPASTTKEDICLFFRGLTVKEAIVNVKLGLGHGCLVKFANAQDACEAHRFNEKSLGVFCVEVRGATDKMWTSALHDCENALDVGERVKSKQSPLRETVNRRRTPISALPRKRPPVKRLPKPPKKTRPDGDSMTTLSQEYIVKVSNLPKTITKTEIKELFGCPDITHKSVLHMLDKEGNRTDTAFILFSRTEDFDYAMNLTGCHLGSNAIEVSSITRKIMKDTMVKSKPRSGNPSPRMGTKKEPSWKDFDSAEPTEEALSPNQSQAALTCLFVSNMPANVKKNQIQRLFCKYKVQKDDIDLLLDGDGNGIGEGVVQFKSQKLAALAQRRHGQDFLGAQVLLTLINVKQMDDILAKNA